jgi:hypothetical protein
MTGDRSESRDNETYVEAPIPIGLHLSFIIYLLGSIRLLIYLNSKFSSGDGRVMGPETLVLFIIIFLAPVLYNYKKSRFEKTRHAVKTRMGGGSVGLLHGTVPFFKLLIYPDALEVRIFFHAYLIPYKQMQGAPEQSGTLSRGLTIRSHLPGVPKKIVFYGLGTTDIITIIEDYKRQKKTTISNHDLHPDENIPDGLINESAKLKSIDAQIMAFAKRVVFKILLVELIAIFGFGFIYSNLMIMIKENKENVIIYKDYQSRSKEAPKKFYRAIIEYNSKGRIEKETFINILGDTTIIKYQFDKVVGTSWDSYSNMILIAFPVIGMALLMFFSLIGQNILSKNRKDNSKVTLADKLQICGFILFFSVFIIGPIKIYLIDALLFGAL